MSTIRLRSVAEDPSQATAFCPFWCVTRHGVQLGEENWVHTGEPLLMADGIRAQVVMSVDPDSGAADGPYILIGTREYTVSEARLLGSALVAAVDTAARTWLDAEARAVGDRR